MIFMGAAFLFSSFLVYHGVQYFFRKNPNLRQRNVDKVAIIELHGAIGVSTSSFGLGEKTISFEAIKKEVDEIFDQDQLQEVILNVNSPGGTPVQTERISTYIMEKAEARKVPVIAFIEDVAASGGYWLACSASQIYASKCSVMGSIGVISQSFGVHKLMDNWGIERRIITSGDQKSVLDPFSPVDEDDVEMVKDMMDLMHQHFIDHVKNSRGSRLRGPEKSVFNGQIMIAAKALNLGLIDGIDTMEGYISRKWGRSKNNVEVFRVKKEDNWLSKLIGGEVALSRFIPLPRELLPVSL